MPIPLLVPAIIAAVGAAASIAGSVASGNAKSKADKQLQERRDKAERKYLHEINTDFLDTDTAQSTLAQLRKQNAKQIEAINNDAVRQGASEEAKVAMAGKLNEGYADATSRLAGFGTQYKQQIEDRYQRRVDGLDDALYNSQLGKADALGGLIGSIGGLTNAGLQAYGAGMFGSSVGSPSANQINGDYARQQNALTIGKNAPTLNNINPNLAYNGPIL